MNPGDRLLCALIGEPKTTFSQWPLHITIVPWFRVSLDDETIIKGLSQLLNEVAPYEVVIGQSTMFGRSKIVNLVKLPNQLTVVEAKTRQYLKANKAWLVEQTTKQKREFRPHVTRQGAMQLKPNQRLIIAQLSLVEQTGE